MKTPARIGLLLFFTLAVGTVALSYPLFTRQWEWLGVNWQNRWFLLLLLVAPVAFWRGTFGEDERTPRLRLGTVAPLVVGPRGFRAWLRDLPGVVRAFAIVLLALAMARPVSTTRPDTESESGIDIVLVLDLSGSMRAVFDAPTPGLRVGPVGKRPTRLDTAKEVIRDFISRRKTDRIGVVVFGKSAFVLSPPTLDYHLLDLLVDKMSLEVIDGTATAIGDAVGVASARLRRSDARSKAIVLLTDGDSNAGSIAPEYAGHLATVVGAKIYTIQIGNGDEVDVQDGLDLFGQPHYARARFPVNPELLKKLAAATNGEAYVATDARALTASMHDVLNKLEKTKFESTTASFEDLFPLLLLAGCSAGRARRAPARMGDAEVSVRFAHPIWLLGALFALVVAALYVWGGIGQARASRRFGDADRMRELVTAWAARRRAWKGVWVVVATALAFVALARPQYGRGTKLIPATNLDVVVVLDFSKSMYARDIAPSRIDRAKAEVARLIRGLPGARFGAVAFAGEPIGFPVTSDGAAIAQFFRQLEPNDMPVGGTAIARALARARELMASDPKSHDHSRVILLVTDGEDLEGDPVSVARSAGEEGTTVHVVQIGGRTPERIPEVGPDGKVAGYRKDESGQPLTTSLSAEGEGQLAQVAQVAAGKIVRSERGSTGIDAIAQDLKRKMTEELAERVETVYADVYVYPLGAALLLLIAEVFFPESARRKVGVKSTPKAAAKGTVAFLGALLLLAWTLASCGFDPTRPFDRQAPEVKRAVAIIDGGDAASAVPLLEEYLATGSCVDGGFGIPDKVRQRPFASLDLGLALFHMGERFGRRFGEEERGGGDGGPSPAEQRLAELRNVEVECALRAVLAIAGEADVPLELRARAQYLAGNLEFLRRGYQEAVRHYEESLKLIPGLVDAADTIGQNAAWNRSIALARIEDEKKKDAGSDGSSNNDNDGGSRGDSGPPRPDGSSGGQDGGGNTPQPEAGPRPQPEAGREPDSGNNSKNQDSPDAAPPPQQPPPSVNQDERMLDMLESAPTFQQQDAKNRIPGRKFRGSADK